MARRYRAYGQGSWIAGSGSAPLAIYNPITSGKAIYVHEFEVRAITRGAAATATSYARLSLVRGSSTGGENVSLAGNDTNDLVPSGLVVVRDCAWSVTEEMSASAAYKKFVTTGNPLAYQANIGRIGNMSCAGLMKRSFDSAVEPIVLRAGESCGLSVSALSCAQVFRANVLLSVSGGGTFSCNTYIRANSEAVGPLAIRNGTASDVVYVHEITIEEVGTLDSPYLQLVQLLIDPVNLADTTTHFPVVKFDTNDAAFPGTIVGNAAVLPANGIPQFYMSDASAGSPRGFNYLGTKDFVGPAFRSFFPEFTQQGTGAGTQADARLVGLSGRAWNLLGRTNPEAIVLRPGEAIGIVSAAELATGATAVAVSGWSQFDFGLTMSAQDLVTPTITLTGLETGAKAAFVKAGTDTLLHFATESAGSISYTFDASPGDFVDIAILAAGYVYQKIEGIELLAAVQTIPVTQVVDPIYDAMLSEAVTFDAATKRIICDAGNTSLSVPATYTEWVDWALTSTNLRYFRAFENQGGTVIDSGAGTSIPAYCYLVNSWRARPQEASHTLAVTDGILLVNGGGDPFVNTLGSYVVRINYQQPVQAITVSTGGGGGTDWTATEREHIRNRLGIDGSASVPSATPTLATATAVAAVQTDVDTLEARLTAGRASNLDNLNATITSRAAPGDAMGLVADALDTAALAASAVAEIHSGLATAADQAAIKAKTDSLTFTTAGQVDANIQYVNDVEVTGNGQTGTEWGPA